MHKLWVAYAVFLLLIGSVIGLLSLFTPVQIGEQESKTEQTKVPATTNEIIVKTATNLTVNQPETSSGLGGYLVSQNISRIQKVPYANNTYTVTTRDGQTVEKTAQAIANNPRIEYAEPNYIFAVATTPNDPKLSKQWAFNATSAQTAWDSERGRNHTTIAIIDTGVQWNHSDLQANIWNNSDEAANTSQDTDNNSHIDDIRGYDFVETNLNCAAGEDCSKEDNNPMDVQGHGTHTAGIAAAVANNSEGIAGVCWHCTIMPVRAGFEYTTGTGLLETDDIVQAITYAADNNASIISMSFGGSTSPQSLENAIEYAADKGVLLIASAGNAGDTDKSYPAGYPEVIAVGATDKNGGKASYSQYGAWVDLSAPGTSIHSTYVDNAYADASGTSMAAPYVAGTAGLLGPHLSHGSRSKTILRTATDPINTSTYVGIGEINVSHTVNLPADIPQPRIETALDDSTVNRTTVINGTVTGNGTSNWTVQYRNGTYTGNWTAVTTNTVTLPANITASLDTRALANTEYSIRLRTEQNGTVTEDRTQVTVQNNYSQPEVEMQQPPNNATYITPNITFNASVYANASLTNVSLYGNWTSTEQVYTTVAHNGTEYTFTVNLANTTGTYSWYIKACYSAVCTESTQHTFQRQKANVTLSSPATNYTTNTSTVQLEWTVQSALQSNAQCHFSRHNASDLNLSNNVSVNMLTNASLSLTNGTHHWQIACTLNNTTVTSDQRTLTVDQIPPHITNRTPGNATHANAQPLAFRWDANDTNTEIATCQLTVNATTTHAANNYTITTNRSLTEGTYHWQITCNDTAGNQQTTATRTLIVDRTPPDPNLSITSNVSVPTPELSYSFNVTYADPVKNSSLTIHNSTMVLCHNCTNATATVHPFSFGKHQLTVNSSDHAGNSKNTTISFSIVRDTDNDGIADVNETDADNDSIADTNDTFIGTVHNIRNTTPITITPKTGNNTGKQNMTIRANTSTAVTFTHNVSATALPLSPITIIYNTSGAAGFVQVTGLQQTKPGKQLYVPRLNTSDMHHSVCVKDARLQSSATFTEACTGVNETYIRCNATGSPTCAPANNGSAWQVTNLSHSAVTTLCTENWMCSGWSGCSNGTQTRNCTDTNACDTTARKPATQQACAVSHTTNANSDDASSGGGGGGSGSTGRSGATTSYAPTTTTTSDTQTKGTVTLNVSHTTNRTIAIISNTTIHLIGSNNSQLLTASLRNGTAVLSSEQNTFRSASFQVHNNRSHTLQLTATAANATHIQLSVQPTQPNRASETYENVTLLQQPTGIEQMQITQQPKTVVTETTLDIVKAFIAILLSGIGILYLIQHRKRAQFTTKRHADKLGIRTHVKYHRQTATDT